jgi:hypothetical protein
VVLALIAHPEAGVDGEDPLACFGKECPLHRRRRRRIIFERARVRFLDVRNVCV